MEKQFFYLVEEPRNSANVDYKLIACTVNRDNEPNYYPISKELAVSLGLKFLFSTDPSYPTQMDLRFESHILLPL